VTAAAAPLPGVTVGDLRRRHLQARHGAANVAHVLATHALLALWFWAGHRFLPWPAYLVLSLPACLVHQRAMSEWIHEGAHHNLVPGRANDALTSLLAGLPFLLPVAAYRAVHFAHHRSDRFFVPEDPDTAFLGVGTRRELRRAVAADLCGLTFARQAARFLTRGPATAATDRGRATTLTALGMGAAALAGTIAAWRLGRLDVPIVYYGTLATLYPLLNRLRTYAQHVSVRGTGPMAGSTVSRTTEGGLFDRVLHTSPRLLYHHEHHRYPALPWRALPALVGDRDDPDRYVRRRLPVLAAVYRRLPA
jgi:fatty acid desaturase